MDPSPDFISHASIPAANIVEEQLVPLFRAFQALHCLSLDEFAALQKQELDRLKEISREKEHWLNIANHLLAREKTVELLAAPYAGPKGAPACDKLVHGIRAQGDRMHDLLVVNQAVAARDLMLAVKTQSMIQRQGEALNMTGGFGTSSQSGVLRYLQDQVEALQAISSANENLLLLICSLENLSKRI